MAHSSYKKIFTKLHSKMYTTKCFIECISENPYCNLEELLHTIRERFHHFDQELFLSSVDFVVRQIINYDHFSDPEEIRLSHTSVFKALIKLSGATTIIAANNNNNNIKHFVDSEIKHKFIDQVNTTISEKIFNSIYCDLIENSTSCSVSPVDGNGNNDSNNVFKSTAIIITHLDT